jgi:hypothetical protein
LSQSGNEVGGPVLAPTTWPDPVPTGAAVQAQNPIAIPTNIPAVDSASFDARITRNAGNSMATILVILALVLAALCVVEKNGAARRAPTIIDQRSPTINVSTTGVTVKVSAGPLMKGSYWYPL